MYTKNGDGYPDEYDYDFEIWEEEVENEIEKFIGEKYEDVERKLAIKHILIHGL